MADQLALFDAMPSAAPTSATWTMPGAGPTYSDCPRCGGGPVFRWLGSDRGTTWSWACTGCSAESCGGLTESQAVEGWERWAKGDRP